MHKKDNAYIKKVLSYISCSGDLKKRIREDLTISLAEKREYRFNHSAEELLGQPREVALEFIENMNLEENTLRNRRRRGYYYVSDTKILGMPLVSVNTVDNRMAKGFFAFGNIALGVFSAGGLSIGVFSFGGLSLGLLISLGGLAMSLGFALGGGAVAYIFAMGGFAAARVLAVGGFAMADMAIGGVTRGIVGFYNQSGSGDFMYSYYNTNWQLITETFKQHISEIKNGLPFLHDFIIKVLKFLFIH